DCVAKLFSTAWRVRLIQDRAPKRNIDSKARVAGFDYFKFQFHRLRLATFATQSARKRTRCAQSEFCCIAPLARQATGTPHEALPAIYTESIPVQSLSFSHPGDIGGVDSKLSYPL